MRKFYGVAMAILILFGGCTAVEKKENTEEKNQLKFGVISSLSGDGGFYGNSVLKGVKLAIKEINATGGVGNKKIAIDVYDDEANHEKAVKIAREICGKNIDITIGPVFSGMCNAAAPVFQVNKKIMITPSGTNDLITNVGEYIFRTAYTDGYQGEIMANFAINRLKGDNIAIMSDIDSNYGETLSERFREIIERNEKKIKLAIKYKGTQTNYQKEIELLKTNNIDTVFLPGYLEVGLIMKQAKESGLKTVFLGGDGWDTEEILKIGEGKLDGNYFCSHYVEDNNNEGINKFIEKYKKEYGENPNVLSALGYDTVTIVVEAMKNQEPQLI